MINSPSNLNRHKVISAEITDRWQSVADQVALMPSAARAMETLVIAHPSPQIVDRSPGPSTPIGSLAQDELHCREQEWKGGRLRVGSCYCEKMLKERNEPGCKLVAKEQSKEKGL